METLLIILCYVLSLIVGAWVVSHFCYWIWWTMGEPHQDGARATNTSGRILSKLGAWVCDKFNAFEWREMDKINPKLQSCQTQQDIDDVMKTKRLNPYKALGVCVFCLAVHISNIMFLSVSVWMLFNTDLPYLAYVFGFANFWALVMFFLKFYFK